MLVSFKFNLPVTNRELIFYVCSFVDVFMAFLTMQLETTGFLHMHILKQPICVLLPSPFLRASFTQEATD